MRIVTLSDHAAEQVQKAQDERAAANEKLRADWQAAVDRRDAKIAERAGAVRQAWAQRRLITAFGTLLELLHAWLQSKPSMPPLLVAGAEEGRFQGGQEGEGRVVARLSSLFDDHWVAFKGYFNRGGETDLLLVGPTAIVALEVKYRNGVVHCEGDAWTCDKSDKYGNVVERGLPVRDAKGRSPGQQVNATADGLQAQLARRGFNVPVRRAVILAHDASRIGRVNEPGVEFIGVLADPGFRSQFLALVQPPPGWRDLDVAALEVLVRQDHQYHVRAKAQRGERSPQEATAVPPARSVANGPAPAKPAAPALARPRPIRFAPPSADSLVPPSELQQRHANALRDDIIALHRTRGQDAALEQRVRKTISGHLQNGGRLGVLSMAECAVKGEAERALLRRLKYECLQTVELEDRTLHAIVVPLAVRWQVPEGADWSGVWIDAVSNSHLFIPSFDLRRVLGARRVVFNNGLHDGRGLLSLEPALLRRALVQIDAGAEPDMPEFKPARIEPSLVADWRIVHLLAVAVTAPGEHLQLNDEARRALAGGLDGIAEAFLHAALEATGTNQAAQAVSEGVWSLRDGVQHGRRLQTRHLLETMLGGMAPPAGSNSAPLRCWYVVENGLRLRLLVEWGTARTEREFWMHGEERPVQAFRPLLDDAVAARVPSGTRVQLEELDLHDYGQQARVLGKSWIGQPPGRPAKESGGGSGPPRQRPSADPAAGGSRC